MKLELKPFEQKYKEQVGKLISTIQREEFGISITLEHFHHQLIDFERYPD